MNKYLLLIPPLCTFLLAGCVFIPLPYEKPFGEEPVEFIEIGSTTREEVILKLGQPDVVARNQTLFVYAAERVVLVYGGLGGGGGKGRAHWYLVIEFYGDGTVERYGEATSKFKFFEFCPCYYCTASGICIPSPYRGVVLAHAEEDAKAKEFSAHLAKCTIYLYHDYSWWMGKALEIPVSLNGHHAGSAYLRGYFLWKVDPGRIEIVSGSGGISSLVFECEAGKTYFIRQVIPFFAGIAAAKLQLVENNVGQEGVRRRKLILSKF